MRIGISLAINQLRLSGALWTPSDILTELWLDASDDSTITESSGSVSAWADKSGNGNGATQVSAPDQPTISGSSITMISKYMSLDSEIAVGDYSIFTVADFTESTSTTILGFTNGSNQVRYYSTGYLAFTNGLSAATASIAKNQTNIVAWVRNGSDKTYYENGTSVGTVSDNSTTLHMSRVGYLSTTANSNAVINEIIVVSSNLSTGERQKVEGYLAWKWNLVSELPSDHPYKYSRPIANPPAAFVANATNIINQYDGATVYPDASSMITPTYNAGSSTITDGVAIDRDDEKIIYYGGPSAPFAGSGIRPNFNHVESQTYTDGVKDGQGVVAFRAECSEIEIILFGNGAGESYRLVVDGEVVNRNTSVISSNNYFYYKYALGSNAIRDFRIEGYSDFAFGGLVLSDGGSMKVSPSYTNSLILMGDSFTTSTGVTDVRAGLAPITAMNLGFENYAISAFGGTGWIKEYYPGYGSTRANMEDRFQTDIIDRGPQMVIAAGGLNDSATYVQADMLDALNNSIDLFQENIPASIMFIVAPWNPSAPAARTGNLALMSADMATVCAPHDNVVFLDPDAVSFTKSDATHPDEAGHATLGAWLTAQVKLELEAMA